MSKKNKARKVLKFSVLLIVILSLVLWLMPVGSIFAGTDEPTELPPGVDAWIPNPFDCPTGCANQIRIPFPKEGSANGDYGDGTLLVTISYHAGGTGEGFSWSTNRPICYLIVKLGEGSWARGYNVSGVSGTWTGVPGTGISHVSFCYADVPTCEGQLTVVKNVGGSKPIENIGTFEFYIQYGSDTPAKFQLTYPNYEHTFSQLVCGDYQIWEDEGTIPAGYEFESIQTTIGDVGGTGNKVVSFTMADDDSGTVTINNKEKEECEGTVTVTKYINGEVATEGSFTIKISYGGDTREFTLDSNNGWSKTLTLPCDTEYEIWEDETSLPSGVVFDKIRSTIQGAVIRGNSIIFTASSGDNGTIGIMNKTETVEELYKIVVVKTTDGLVVANTDFNFNLVGPGTNVTKTIKAGAGSSGNITFENLKAGSYILTETNTGFNTWVSFSPDPKTSGSSGKTVTINLPADAKDNIVYVYFHNDPSKEPPPKGKILVVKSVEDGLTGTFNFTVTDKNGTVVATTSITISKGEKIDSITISGLDPGTYTVTEAKGKGFVNKVPGDYVVDGVLVIKGDTATVSFTNVPKEVPPPEVKVLGIEEEAVVEVLGITEELPYTGFNWLFSIAGLMLIALGGAILVIRFKPRKGMK